MRYKLIIFLGSLVIMACYACNGFNKNNKTVTYKGLYSFGPEVKSFKDCDNGHEYWVTDSSANLELQYKQLNFEKPYEPVYVEVQGQKVRSGKEGMGSEYDSTLVVRKVIKITKQIPENMCN